MLAGLKEKDRVVTIGGIHGVVTNVQRDREEVTIRVDEATGAKLSRQQIGDLETCHRRQRKRKENQLVRPAEVTRTKRIVRTRIQTNYSRFDENEQFCAKRLVNELPSLGSGGPFFSSHSLQGSWELESRKLKTRRPRQPPTAEAVESSGRCSRVERRTRRSESSPSTYTILLMVVAIFVLPILIGNWLAKSFRMPEHSWKFAVASWNCGGRRLWSCGSAILSMAPTLAAA